MSDPSPVEHVPDAPVPTPTDQDVIDQALVLVAADHHRLAGRLGPVPSVPPGLDELRAGPLGKDLARLALVAEGRSGELPEPVLTAIEAVLQLFFWPAGADDYAVPRAFWSTDLGRLLARAKFRACAEEDLVGIGAAAQRLGVSRPTIYRWMDDRSLDYVHDQISGRSYVLRSGLDEQEQALPS